MTEIKNNDVVKITSTDEDLNGIFLVSSIHTTEIVLKAPPNKEYTLSILDGVIDQITSIVVIYSSKVSGYAERMGYVLDKRVCITFTDGIEECGIIKKVEYDTIDIELDNGSMIYVDFEYEGVPEGIVSIRLDELLQIDEIEEYYIFPENKHRYPLASQLIDLMDSLIKTDTSTTKNIKHANLIVKRFKELKTLYSTQEGLPRILPANYKPYVHPHQVDWIVPSVHVNYPLYSSEESIDFWREVETLQTGRGSYMAMYKQILDQMKPFTNDLNGQQVLHTVQAVLPSNKFVHSKCKDDAEIFIKKWTPLMLNEPYQSIFSTTHERVDIDGYYSLDESYKTYSKLHLPQTKLLHKLNVEDMKLKPVYSTFHKHLQNCIPEMSDILSNLDPFLSIHSAIQQVEPYLVYANDVQVQYTSLLTQQLDHHIQQYKQRSIPDSYVYTPPPQMVDPVYGMNSKSPSEWHLWTRRGDCGRLYTLYLQSSFEIEYLQSLKDKLHLSDPKGVTPPVVKQYASLDAVRKDKGKTIFWDKELDNTNYEEMKSYPTELLLRQYLVDIKEMSMPLAKQYAPHFLNKKKVVVDGDYAKMNDVYFKRVSNEWVVDETCTGPYPCVSNEPNCTTDCVDITFRFNENTKHTILSEYTDLSYINETTRTSELSKQMDQSKIMWEKISHLRHQSEYLYNNKMLPLRESVSVNMSSVHQPLLFFILQKPHYERYKELAAFIAMYTRPPGKGELDTWLYCSESNTPLVPSVYLQLIEVYASPEKYEVFIKDGLIREIIVRDDENYILKDSGYPVGPIAFSQVFDDLVRSSELNEEALFDVPRLIHEDTPVIIQLLSEIGTIAKIAMTKYFNFIVREMDKQPKSYILLSIGYMFKIASIIYTFNVSDGIDAVLKHQEKLFRIMKSNGFTEEYTLSDKSIMNSIVTVSSKFAIQQLVYAKERKMGNRTAHTIWNTFLPPVEVKSIQTERVHPMNILVLLHQEVQSKQPLRPGNHKVNTCKCSFQYEAIQKLISQYPVRKPIQYSQEVAFKREEFVPTYEEGIQPFQAFKLVHTEPIQKEQTDFVERMSEVRTRLHRCITIPDQFFVPNIPLVYLKEFITLISVIFPEILKNSYLYTLTVSPIILPIISATHQDLLSKLTSKHYFNTLCTMFPDSSGLGLHSVSSSVEIKQILKNLETPMSEMSIYELYYYIFRIFEIYITNSDPSKSCVLIQQYIDIFMMEKASVFLTYEEIRRNVVKIKTKESNDRRLKLLGLSPADKAIQQFREENNLDPEARIGRLRTYNADAFESLYAVFHSKETEDNGSDGNIFDAD
jgi:hypothetical protein